MMTIPLTLTFLTPAFIGGANNTGHAEFRLSSLKGILRYWWRQFQDQSNPQALFDKESGIFGSTKGQSRVWLRLLTPITQLRAMEEDSPGSFERDGVRYLWYSCERRPPGQAGRQKWIKPNSVVEMELRLTADPTETNEVLLALYFAQTFGGLGYRSRRGAGSFQLAVDPVPVHGNQLAAFATLLTTTGEDFKTAYTQQSANHSVWSKLIHSASPLATALATVNYFKPVTPAPKAQTCGDVLNHIGQLMKRYRSVLQYQNPPPPALSLVQQQFHREACSLHAAGSGAAPASVPTYSGPNPISKSAFGLPIIYRFRSRNAAGIPIGHEQWWIDASPAGHERRASPLHISVKRDAQNVPYANLLVLWNEFLPSGEDVALTKKKRDPVSRQIVPSAIGSVNQPTDKVLTAFLAQF